MTTYILLRKNKEIGPFSLDGLKAYGVLPDDLFWAEGQSVCWLKQGEINELKDLAARPPLKIPEDLSTYQPAEERPADAETLLHSLGTHNKPGNTTQAEVEKKGITNTITPLAGTLAAIKENNPVQLETRYAKPLDDIKEIYLKNLELQQSKKRVTIQIPAPVRRAAPYAAFLVIGIVAGVLINKAGESKLNMDAVPAPVTKPVETLPVSITEKQTTPAVVPADVNEEITGTVSSAPLEETPEKPVSSTERIIASKKTIPGKSPQPAETGINPATPLSKPEERPSNERSITTEPIQAPVENIASLVSVKTNDYEVGSFGGIRNLQLTVKNDSKYVLDKVTVELQYLKPMDELLRAESIYFLAVPPGGIQTLPVPKSNRGVKVTCRVLRVESKQAVVSTARLSPHSE